MLGMEMLLKSLGITPEMMKGLEVTITQTAARLERIEAKQDEILAQLARVSKYNDACISHLVEIGVIKGD